MKPPSFERHEWGGEYNLNPLSLSSKLDLGREGHGIFCRASSLLNMDRLGGILDFAGEAIVVTEGLLEGADIVTQGKAKGD